MLRLRGVLHRKHVGKVPIAYVFHIFYHSATCVYMVSPFRKCVQNHFCASIFVVPVEENVIATFGHVGAALYAVKHSPANLV